MPHPPTTNISSVDKKNKQKNLFVQEKGQFQCPHRGLFHAISEEQGFRCVCRRARCSYCCQRNHGKKESCIVQEYARLHFVDRLWVKGPLKLPYQSNQADHDRSFDYFHDLLRKRTKEEKITIKFRGRYHADELYDKHLDYVAWSDCRDLKKVQSIWYECAKRAGFVNYACKPINTLGQLRGWCDYMFRRYHQPGRKAKVVYLMAKDGTDIIRGSNGFFQGTTHKQLWEQVKVRQRLTEGTSNKTTSNYLALRYVHEIMESELPIDAKILKLLPETKDESRPVGCFLYLTGYSVSQIVQTLMSGEQVRWDEDRVWLDTGKVPSISWLERLFGQDGIPYHEDWFPRPTNYQKETNRIIRSTDDRLWLDYQPDNPMTEEELLAELRLIGTLGEAA